MAEMLQGPAGRQKQHELDAVDLPAPVSVHLLMGSAEAHPSVSLLCPRGQTGDRKHSRKDCAGSSVNRQAFARGSGSAWVRGLHALHL